MISASPEDYSYVQVDRPIRNGGRFLSQVRAIGERALGTEPRSSISEFHISPSDEDDTGLNPVLQHAEVPTFEPVLKVVQDNDFDMVLLHRSAPPGLASRYSFGYLQAKLSAPETTTHRADYDEDGTRISNRYKTHLPPLSQELDDITNSHNANSDNLRVLCDRVDIIGEPGGDLVLGLTPKTSERSARILHEQSAAAYHRLRVISNRTANPLSPWQVTAPFARIPGNITDAQYDYLLGGIDDVLPVRVLLGGVEYSSRDRAR